MSEDLRIEITELVRSALLKCDNMLTELENIKNDLEAIEEEII